MSIGIQERHGHSGENRTSSLLLDGGFGVLARIPDVDGADLLVQLPFRDLRELRERAKRIEAFGIAQSKFFERGNEVTVRAEYVLESDHPRSEFFAFVHTLDTQGRPDLFFFSAEDIQRTWRRRGDHFVFSLGPERKYDEFLNLPPTKIWEAVAAAIERTQAERNERFVEMVLARSRSHAANDSRPYQSEGGHWVVRDDLGTERSITEPTGPPGTQDYDPLTDTWTTRG